MAINKGYKQGAGDVGKVAGKAMDKIADEISGSVDNLKKTIEKQYDITNSIFDVIDDLSDEIDILKYGESFINFSSSENLEPGVKAIINKLIHTIAKSSDKCKNIASLITKKYPVGRYSDITGQDIGKLNADMQKLCIFYVYVLLRFSDGDNSVYERASSFLKYFALSEQTKNEISTYVDSMSEEDILNLIQGTKQEKCNIIAAGVNSSEVNSVINFLFNQRIVAPKFNQNNCEIEAITTEESSISLSGIFNISDDAANNNLLADKIINHISKQHSGNIITDIVYCVNVENDRFFDYEKVFLEKILYETKIRVVFALISCTSKKKAKSLENNIIERMKNFDCMFVNILTESISIYDNILYPFGNDDLSNIICNGGISK